LPYSPVVTIALLPQNSALEKNLKKLHGLNKGPNEESLSVQRARQRLEGLERCE
jgi:hypothetical protein